MVIVMLGVFAAIFALIPDTFSSAKPKLAPVRVRVK